MSSLIGVPVYLGDHDLDAVVRVPFSSFNDAGGSVTMTGFVVGDVKIYKDGGTTEKTTTNGITISLDFDTRTGLHSIDIDTGNDTGDAGFWADAAEYWVALADVTVDAQTVRRWLASFSVTNRAVESLVTDRGIAQAGTATSITLAATAPAVDDTFNFNHVAITAGTGIGQVRLISNYVGASRLASIVGNVFNPIPDSTSRYVVGNSGGVNLEFWRGFSPNPLQSANVPSQVRDATAAGASRVTSALSLVGTADSGTTTTLVDASRTEADVDYWKDSILMITSGSIDGQMRRITAFDPVTDTITVSPAFTQAVSTNTYEILRTAIAIAAAAGGDWTDPEKENIRDALGVTGTKTAATGGQLQDLTVGNFNASFFTAVEDAIHDALESDHQVANSFGRRFTLMRNLLANKVIRTSSTLLTVRNDIDTADLFTIDLTGDGRVLSVTPAP